MLAAADTADPDASSCAFSHSLGRLEPVTARESSRSRHQPAAHISFPGLGRVRAEGAGYRWVPLQYGVLR